MWLWLLLLFFGPSPVDMAEPNPVVPFLSTNATNYEEQTRELMRGPRFGGKKELDRGPRDCDSDLEQQDGEDGSAPPCRSSNSGEVSSREYQPPPGPPNGDDNRVRVKVYLGLKPEAQSAAHVLTYFLSTSFNVSLSNFNFYVPDSFGQPRLQRIHHDLMWKGSFHRTKHGSFPDDHHTNFRLSSEDDGKEMIYVVASPPRDDQPSDFQTGVAQKTTKKSVRGQKSKDSKAEDRFQDTETTNYVVAYEFKTNEPNKAKKQEPRKKGMTNLPKIGAALKAASKKPLPKALPKVLPKAPPKAPPKKGKTSIESYNTTDPQRGTLLHYLLYKNYTNAFDVFYLRIDTEFVARDADRWWWSHKVVFGCHWQQDGSPVEPFLMPEVRQNISTAFSVLRYRLEYQLQAFLEDDGVTLLTPDEWIDFRANGTLKPFQDPRSEAPTASPLSLPMGGDPGIGLTQKKQLKPINSRTWDSQRSFGLALLSVTLGTVIMLTQLSYYTQRRRITKTVWTNLASEEGVKELLRTGWTIKGDKMEIFDKTNVGYGDDDSMLIGGYEQRAMILGTEITVTQPESEESPTS